MSACKTFKVIIAAYITYREPKPTAVKQTGRNIFGQLSAANATKTPVSLHALLHSCTHTLTKEVQNPVWYHTSASVISYQRAISRIIKRQCPSCDTDLAGFVWS